MHNLSSQQKSQMSFRRAFSSSGWMDGVDHPLVWVLSSVRRLCDVYNGIVSAY